MPSSITLTDKQQVDAGVTILDQDNQPFATLPAGVTVDFTTSDSNVAPITVHDDGMNITINSGNVGTATVTATVNGIAGLTTPSDTIAVAVQNSAPNSVNFTVGTPTDET